MLFSQNDELNLVFQNKIVRKKFPKKIAPVEEGLQGLLQSYHAFKKKLNEFGSLEEKEVVSSKLLSTLE